MFKFLKFFLIIPEPEPWITLDPTLHRNVSNYNELKSRVTLADTPVDTNVAPAMPTKDAFVVDSSASSTASPRATSSPHTPTTLNNNTISLRNTTDEANDANPNSIYDKLPSMPRSASMMSLPTMKALRDVAYYVVLSRDEAEQVQFELDFYYCFNIWFFFHCYLCCFY